MTPPSSAPPVFTPPEIAPEFLLEDEFAQIDGNYTTIFIYILICIIFIQYCLYI